MAARLVVLGAVQFSARCLSSLYRHGADVVGVVTCDERAAARHADVSSLEPLARAAGTPCLLISDVNAEATRTWIASRHPDVLLVVGWSQLLSSALLSLPVLASIGAHPTLLPEGRGRHPIIWTLVLGLSQGGLTFFILDSAADTGDVLLQERFDIESDDDAGRVYEQVCRLGEQMMPTLMREIESGFPHRRPQDDARATVYPKRSAGDGQIAWNQPAATVRNLVRALAAPYPGAHTFVSRNGHLQRLTIWQCSLVPDTAPNGRVPGTVLFSGAHVLVQAGDQPIRIERAEPAGLLREGDVLVAES